MSDTQLTTLSTLAWLVGTTALFVVLARWSAGGSWGISTAIARGLIGWTGRNGTIAGEWPIESDVPPIDAPLLDQLWGTRRIRAADQAAADLPIAEIEDLGTRRIS